MVDGARLESVYRGDSIVGSNPTVSATQSKHFYYNNLYKENQRETAPFRTSKYTLETGRKRSDFDSRLCRL